MQIPKKKSISSIAYYIITTDDKTNFYHIPQEFHNSLDLIRQLPRDLVQFNNSLEYYYTTIENKLFSGIDLYVLSASLLSQNDNKNILDLYVKLWNTENNLKVFLVNGELSNLNNIINQINELSGIKLITSFNDNEFRVKKNSGDLYFNGIDDFFLKVENYRKEILQSYKNNSPEYQSINFNIETENNFDKFNENIYFQPCYSNFFTINQVIRNYWSGEDRINLENPKQIIKQNSNFKIRWTILLDKVKAIDALKSLLKVETNNPHETIILVFPFQNPKLKDQIKDNAKSRKAKLYLKLLSAEQDIDFCNFIDNIPDNIPEDEIKELISVSSLKEQSRLIFLDCLAYLHASFQFSPIVRFPLLGSSINKELSFLKAKKQQFSDNKTIWNFGRKLSERILPKLTADYLCNRNSQVFVISDLPIEWLDINGVPLCFTHDICRLPETNYRSLLNNYIVNQRFNHIVSKNILSKTLVILGASNEQGKDEEFKKWYGKIYELSSDLGFSVANCSNKQEVINVIQKQEPDLLIFDCHGNFDEKTLSSFLWINNDKLTGQDIIENKISAPIVFLSACNTNPIYGYTNLIGEAFFQAGAKAVTSTFLPIDVDEGSILYLRLLQQLAFVSDKSIFQNWLSFVCSIIRNSVILKMIYTFKDKGNIDNEKLLLMLDDMHYFDKRRDVYDEIKTLNYSHEYLYYTHLGRADLILFEDYLEKKHKQIPVL
jgi:hypothetical protein